MQNVMSGQHVEDRCSIRELLSLPDTYKSIKGWKIAFSMDLGYFGVDPEVQVNTRRALEVFRSFGCEIVEVAVGWSWDNLKAWITHWEGLFTVTTGQYLDNWRDAMDPIVVGLLERGRSHTASDMYRVTVHRGAMWRTLGPILEEHNLLICPTNAVPSVPAQHNQASDFNINGVQTHGTYGWFLTNPFNLMSECPVMSVPTGFASNGVPTGIQIVGKTFDDASVFRAAAAYEAANPWIHARPDV